MKTSNACPLSTPNLYESVALHRATGPTIRPGGLSLLEYALTLYPFGIGSRVLDVGCGMGATVAHLRQHHRLSAAGLDLSQKLLAASPEHAPGLPLMRARAETLPVMDHRLDGLICECVLSLVSDPLETLSEFFRVLVPGGILILSDIYRRNPRHASGDMDVDCCLSGAATRGELLDWIGGAGFSISLWEDHSQLLAELAAKLVFMYGSMAAFWTQFAKTGDGHKLEELTRDMRPGYYLIVARKG